MLKSLILKPGVNRENTRYSTEGTWFECDKIRFRQGTPEKIGGWARLSANTYEGVCRSLFNWTTLGGQNLVGVGTHLKFYIERGGAYNDVTPIRESSALTDPFSTTLGSPVVTVTDASHGARTGDYVVFSGADVVAGLDLNEDFAITVVDDNTYTVLASGAADATVGAGGGATVTADYQIHVGAEIPEPIVGWGAGGYGLGAYGEGTSSIARMRLWSQANFGQNLVFTYRGGPLFYWSAADGLATRAIFLEDLPGADNVPQVANYVLVSDFSRFVFAFGCDGSGGSDACPMRIRWSDQENAGMWAPSALNQAGELRLSRGTEIVTAMQARQEILVWTDAALYSLQYLGAPDVWGSQLVGENISILSQNAAAYANGVAYWMGRETFYRYDGTVLPLPCDLRRHVFSDFNYLQEDQVFAGTVERFNEIWWFYCSAGSTMVDRYVVYNYLENVWYYGSLERTAWMDSPIRGNPMAATYANSLVYHEVGCDNLETSTPQPIPAFISSAEFDLDDGDSFMFIRRVLPDVTFEGSTSDAPALSLGFYPLKGSGSGFTDPRSVGGEPGATVSRFQVVPVETYTNQVFVRLRGRQMVIRVESTELGVTWQLGKTRLDMQPDGRRG
jgi:hypothetical protein